MGLALDGIDVSTGDDCPIHLLSELRAGERSCVIGTLFKKMDLKPSILKETSGVVS